MSEQMVSLIDNILQGKRPTVPAMSFSQYGKFLEALRKERLERGIA